MMWMGQHQAHMGREGVSNHQIPCTITASSDMIVIKNAESLIAEQMAALSVEAREKAYMDMHGVPAPITESSELMEQSLVELQNEIDSIREKDVYNLAWETDRAFVEKKEFRLHFLRSTDMDTARAAARIVRHFELKLDLFGPDSLTSTITQDDLNQDDMDALYNGRARFLPAKDRAGRAINLIIAGQRAPTQSVLRRAFYNVMKDPQSLQQGVVIVVYALGEDPSPDPQLTWKLPKLHDGLPLRASAVHFCQQRSIHNTVFAYLIMAFNAFTRTRIRMHCGTHEEVLSYLQGYGIEPGSLPIDPNGRIEDLEDYRHSLMLQRSRERLLYPRRSKIHVPAIFDVLFGKGTPFQDHSGNRRFRGMIADAHKMYEKSGRGEKLRVAQDIVDNVIQDSGMFLKPDDMGSWNCVDNETARSKVSSTFRTLRKKKPRGEPSCGNNQPLRMVIADPFSLKKSACTQQYT